MFICFKEEQPENAPCPILMTESGMFICFKEEQPENAPRPILMTESGMLICFKEKQFAYLQPVITQYFASNKSEIWS